MTGEAPARLKGVVGRAATPPRVILALAFAIFLVYAWPGYMSLDSAEQLGQARDGQYSDGHPPAMAALWHLIDLVIPGPGGMLLLQGSLFLVGTYWLLRRHFTGQSAAIAAGAILLFPPVFAPMAVVWKDCQMAGFLMMGIALVTAPRPSRRWLGVVSLGFAIAMRHNGLVAALPIVLGLFVAREGLRPWKRVALAFVVWLGVSGAAITANRLLTRVHAYPWYYSVGPGDIVGILRNGISHYPDAELLELLDGAPLIVRDHIAIQAQHIYNPAMWWGVVNGPERLFDWPDNATQRAAIERTWRALVLAHPLSYLRHRLRVFRLVLGLTDEFTVVPVYNPVWRLAMNERDQIEPVPSAGLQGVIGDSLDWLARTPIYRPYIYFVLALLFLPLARRERDVLALLASGLLYELTLLPFAPAPEFRYSHWMITATVIATVILVKRRLDRRA